MRNFFQSLFVLFFVICNNIFAQSDNHNYIKTTEYLETVLVESNFNSSYSGWLPNGNANISLENGSLKVNVDSAWEGVKHPLEGFLTTQGEVLYVNVNFDKGDTQSNIRVYLHETDQSGNLVAWNELEPNLQSGSHQFSLLMQNTGNKLIFRIDKLNTNTTSNTNFYIDYVSLKQGGNANSIEKKESITYFDGFGKAKQTIGVRQTPNEKDILQHIEYDEFGRSSKQYMAVPTIQNTGNYVLNPVTEITNYYQTNFLDQHPFAENRYDNSPLNRVLETSSPGNTWELLPSSDNDHTVKFERGVNQDQEVYRFDIDEGNSAGPLLRSYYDEGQLLKNVTKNANWQPSDGLLNTTAVFTDKKGRKIAEFNYEDDSGSEKKLSTYYVYDDQGNLRYVLTPKLIDNIVGNPIDDYSENWPENDFLEQGDAGLLSVSFSINNFTNNELTFTARRVPSQFAINDKVLKPQTVKILNTSSQIPDMYLGPIKAYTGLTDINGDQIPAQIGVAEIQNGNLVVTRTSSIAYNTISISIFVDLNGQPISQQELDDLAFQYKYDEFNRQIEQKVPGKDWEYMVYDQLDRPILTQDANLRVQNSWLFNKYDAYGRVIYSGLYSNNATREAMQDQVDNFITSGVNLSNIEYRSTSVQSIGGVSMNYTNTAFPNSNLETLTVSYYDDYSFADSNMPNIPSTILDQEVTNRTKGLLTATWTKVLETSSWSKSYSFYDKKGRVIYIDNENYLGGYTRIKSKLDFRGKVEQAITEHQSLSLTPLNIEDNYEYDHVERPIRHYQKINAQQEELINENYCNELGQLQTKNVGGSYAIGGGLQTIDYTYNIRGWLSKVNDVNNLGLDLFTYKLNYNESIEGTASVSDIYNGNIKQVVWKSAYNNLKQSYAYEYDKLNRFIEAQYRDGNTLSSNAGKNETYSLDYDANGNISKLSRNNDSGVQMDKLGYSYDEGNRLLSIDDITNNRNGFNDRYTPDPFSLEQDDYYYDSNGNLIKDNNKGISLIEYNHLDLVERVTFSNGNVIAFTYDANGTKLKMDNIVYEGATTTTHYIGGFQYTNNDLTFFPTAEGYVIKDGNNYEYVYIFSDHLGNNRLSYHDSNNDNSISSNEILSNTNYYPMGLIHRGQYNSGYASLFNYKYQSKEQLNFTSYNMYDFGSRMYDAAVGRWFNTDPQNQFSSPYLAMGNNPVMLIDPNGEIVWGAVLLGAIIGAGSSAAVYTAISLSQDNFSIGGLLGAAFGGALTGGIGGAIAPKAVVGGIVKNGMAGSIGKASLGGLASGFLPSANLALNDNLSLSLSPALAFGQASGIGGNASLNASFGDFNSSIGVGGTFFGKAHGTGKSVFETRLSAGLGYGGKDFNIQAYSTAYYSGETSQVVGGVGINSGDFTIRHENDFLGDRYDRYRTAALEASYKGFTAGFSLFTGDPYQDRRLYNDPNGEGEYGYPGNYNPGDNSFGPNGSYIGPNAGKYRLGAGYIGYKGLRVGLNSERIRNGIQNSLHDKIGSPRFPMLNTTQKSYFQYLTHNPFSLW